MARRKAVSWISSNLLANLTHKTDATPRASIDPIGALILCKLSFSGASSNIAIFVLAKSSTTTLKPLVLPAALNLVIISVVPLVTPAKGPSCITHPVFSVRIGVSPLSIGSAFAKHVKAAYETGDNVQLEPSRSPLQLNGALRQARISINL